RELVERRLGLLLRLGPGARADQQGPLPDPFEVDLGRGEAPPLPAGLRERRAHRAGCALASWSLCGEMVTSNTCTTGPPSRTVGPSTTDSAPPSTSTWTRSPTNPRRCATAAEAHAPVPHDKVSPAPRSHTRIASRSGPATAMNSR